MLIGSIEFDNLVGGYIAVIDNLLIIALLTARLAGKPIIEHWLGLLLISSLLPLIYLLLQSPSHERVPIYYLWLSLMILFLVIELLLDYIWKIDFRQIRWMAISYVMLLCGATGGMIGVASMAGRGWTIASAVTFLTMIALAFYQRAKTGI